MIKAENYDIVGSYNNQRISEIDSERSINCFEYPDILGKKDKNLLGTSGLLNTELSFVGAEGPARAQFVFNGIQYAVMGKGLYSIDADGIESALFTGFNTSTGYLGVDANTFQVIFVDGTNGWIWDTSAASMTMISDQSFPTQPVDICYLDGFFVVADGGTNNFQLSSFNQGLVWGPAVNVFTADDTAGNNWLIIGASTLTGGSTTTQNYRTGVPFEVTTTGSLPSPLEAGKTYYAITVFSSPGVIDNSHIRVALSYADAIGGVAIVLTSNGSVTNTMTSKGQLQLGSITSHPGTIVACRTLHRRLFLFSQNFVEVWENAGLGANLPFRRINSALMEYGTPAPGSISVSFDMMVFLSQTKDGQGAVMQVNGVSAIPISTRALDFQIAQYAALGEVADCQGFLIKENGIIFYRMNFTKANHTFVYNVTFSNPENDSTKRWHEEELLNGDRHPAQTHAYFNGLNYVGDYRSSTMYLLDVNTYTNDGEAIRRARISHPEVTAGYQRRRIDRLQFDLLQGTINQILPPIPATFVELENDSGIALTEAGNNVITEDSEPGSGSIIIKPTLYFSYSKDGGQTYGYVSPLPMGNVGQRTFRTVVRKLGVVPRGQAFVCKIEFYDPIPFALMGAAWAYEILPE